MFDVYIGNSLDDTFSHRQFLKFTLLSLAKGDYQMAAYELRQTIRKARWEIHLRQIEEELTTKKSSVPSVPESLEEEFTEVTNNCLTLVGDTDR